MYRKLGVLALGVVALTSCGNVPDWVASRSQVEAVQQQVSELREQARKDRADVTAATAMIAGMKQPGKSAIFDPADRDGYQPMRTMIGTMLLSVEDVRAMADGSEIKLMIGNPYAVSLMGIDLEVTYGNRYKEGANYGEWLGGLHSKKASIPTPIYSGSWNPVSISLPKVKPAELGYVEVAGEINRLTLAPR